MLRVPREPPFLMSAPGLNLRASPVGVLKRRRIRPKDASQLICVFSISCGEHQSAECGARRGGGMEEVMPAPPAQEIKAAAAALPASKALVPRRPVSQRVGCFPPTASMVVVTISESWFDLMKGFDGHLLSRCQTLNGACVLVQSCGAEANPCLPRNE